MPNNTGGSRRPKWLNWYRISTLGLLLFVAITQLVTSSKVSDVAERSFAPITVEQAGKVKTAASLLQMVGFTRPVYLGIKPGVEGEYPTFQVEAIGGQPLEVFIRTTKTGGMEIQPTKLFHTVGSADQFARLAEEAVDKWEHMPPTIQPRTDGSYGEYESRKYDYDNLAKYKTADYGIVGDETSDWPRK